MGDTDVAVTPTLGDSDSQFSAFNDLLCTDSALSCTISVLRDGVSAVAVVGNKS